MHLFVWYFFRGNLITIHTDVCFEAAKLAFWILYLLGDLVKKLGDFGRIC
ncbi:MAG: hypothetical protein JWQ54_3391 [Mucilaginibacter sp.]|nr:hypothetical protein [Mucilaginibacter sp.]